MPVFGGEILFEFCETTFRGADEVAYGGVGLAHLIECFLGGDATIHDPCAPLFAVAVGDFLEHVGQRGFVRGIAAHDFITDRKAVRGDDEIKAQLDGGMFEAGVGRAVFGEEVDLADVVAFIYSFNSAGPSSAVAVVVLAEIEQGFLNGTAPGEAAVFHDTPIYKRRSLPSLNRLFARRNMIWGGPYLRVAGASMGWVSTTGIFAR